MKSFRKKKKHRIFHEQLYELFKRYFEGTVSDHEQKIVETWIPEKDRKNDLWYSEEMLEKDRIQIYKKLSRHFRFKTENTIESLIARKRQTTLLKPLAQFVAAASIALVLGLAGWLYFQKIQQFNSQEKELIATMDGQYSSNEKRKLHLDDGSFIQMNAGTNVYLIKNEFNKQKRELWMEGEAFFDVAKNPEKAFFIHSGNMQVVVHGTSFTIKAYHELDEYIVSVKTGKVEVISDNQSLIMLTPNKQLVYHMKSRQYEVNEINWEDVAIWMDGTLAFNNASREELTLRFQQNYGVILTYTEDALKDVKLNARFPKGSSLQDVLENISKLYDIGFSIKDKQVVLYKLN